MYFDKSNVKCEQQFKGFSKMQSDMKIKAELILLFENLLTKFSLEKVCLSYDLLFVVRFAILLNSKKLETF